MNNVKKRIFYLFAVVLTLLLLLAIINIDFAKGIQEDVPKVKESLELDTLRVMK